MSQFYLGKDPSSRILLTIRSRQNEVGRFVIDSTPFPVFAGCGRKSTLELVSKSTDCSGMSAPLTIDRELCWGIAVAKKKCKKKVLSLFTWNSKTCADSSFVVWKSLQSFARQLLEAGSGGGQTKTANRSSTCATRWRSMVAGTL